MTLESPNLGIVLASTPQSSLPMRKLFQGNQNLGYP